MKIVFLTGSHPRHAYIARQLAETSALAGLVIEEREEFVPSPPEGLPESTRKLFIHHFERREQAEKRFFGEGSLPERPGLTTRRVTVDQLNGPAVWSLLDTIRPDLVLSYGVHKLSPETLAKAPGRAWNIHGGLSPWYRGVITHFWPSYLLEPQMTGMTLHETTEAIDGGNLVHQTAAPMVRGDGLHDVACRAVTALGEELPALVETISRQGGPHATPTKVQTTTGRIWRSSDWRPAHLHLIYEHYGDRIVDHYLDGAFEHREPRLYRQF